MKTIHAKFVGRASLENHICFMLIIFAIFESLLFKPYFIQTTSNFAYPLSLSHAVVLVIRFANLPPVT